LSLPLIAVRIRRDSSIEHQFSLRFRVAQGFGVLSRMGHGEDLAPAPAGEIDGVGGRALRGGRFVHIGKNGRRLGYSFARLTGERLAAIPADQWVELVPATEYGIRYLVVRADDVALEERRGAAPVSSLLPSAARVSAPSGAPEAEPAPARRSPADDLTDMGISALNTQELTERLRAELERSADLARRVDALTVALDKSGARERDLM
jgi:hypothetical protein